ncbi:MAG TPA: DUF433 domain-containing protein [Tepidisphaeraceae bacterium]|jgi:uncharacterized protein (DUF433 family)|nr:DUF433 domain-containing protein [Tepidisphaeraceae bacterium]
MQMEESTTYVRSDEHGVLRVGATRVMLDSVLEAWEEGHSPETIRGQYPSLTLAEVYGAITWCLSHSEELAKYLKLQDAAWMEGRARAAGRPSELRDRLQASRDLGQKR